MKYGRSYCFHISKKDDLIVLILVLSNTVEHAYKEFMRTHKFTSLNPIWVIFIIDIKNDEIWESILICTKQTLIISAFAIGVHHCI